MRARTPSFVLELKLNTSKADKLVLDQRFEYACRIYNVLVRHCRKQLFRLLSDKEYRHWWGLLWRNPSEQERKVINAKLAEIRAKYGLTEYALHAYVVKQQHRYQRHIDSNTAQKVATEAWSSVSDYLFSDGKEMPFKRVSSFMSVEGKNNTAGIRFKDGKLHWLGLKIYPKIDKSDLYAQLALTRRAKYCRILRRKMGTGYHYYLQLILEGIPPQKHAVGTGRCGIDIGPSTIAIVTDHSCELEMLGDGAKRYQEQIAELERQMDRSKRATNPDNYLPDGTIRKGRIKWRYSKNYRVLRQRKAVLERKDTALLKQAHEIRVNKLLAHADEIYVENMDMAGLAERSKADRVDANGHPMRKKRYGKSIENNAPSRFLAILNRKLQYQNKVLLKVDTTKFRASQYNHVSDTYIRKTLDERSMRVGNYLMQRDLYAAFLLMNSKPDLESPDRARCNNSFAAFVVEHDKCIEALLNSKREYPSSFGLVDFAA